jgi:hypothetical protein
MIRYCELAILLVVIMQVSSNSAIESVSGITEGSGGEHKEGALKDSG